MATSSIFSNVKISDPVSAKKFVDALESSSAAEKHERTEFKMPLTDPSSIKNLIVKRKSVK